MKDTFSQAYYAVFVLFNCLHGAPQTRDENTEVSWA